MGMVALGVMLSVYFATFQQGFTAVFPALLLVSGLVLMMVMRTDTSLAGRRSR